MFLEHINLTVSDLQRSIDLYSDLLGLHVRWQGTTSDGTPAAHVGDDHCYLALFQSSPELADRPAVDYSAVGLNHFGFVVDDLDAARARLTKHGLSPHLEGDYEPGRRLYFFDPDGIEVELVQYEPAVVAG